MGVYLAGKEAKPLDHSCEGCPKPYYPRPNDLWVCAIEQQNQAECAGAGNAVYGQRDRVVLMSLHDDVEYFCKVDGAYEVQDPTKEKKIDSARSESWSQMLRRGMLGLAPKQQPYSFAHASLRQHITCDVPCRHVMQHAPCRPGVQESLSTRMRHVPQAHRG